MSLISRKSNDVLKHLERHSVRKHEGIHTVTAQEHEQEAEVPQQRESPFGKLVYGEGSGARPTSYKPILPL